MVQNRFQNALYKFLEIDCSYNRRLAVVGGLASIPARRTFDGRLKTIPADVKERMKRA